MSMNAIVNDQNVNTSPTSALDISSEVITNARVTYDTGEKDEKTQQPILEAIVVSEDIGKKAEETASIEFKVKGKTETYAVSAVEYFSSAVYKANSLAGVSELCPNDEEVCNMFNRGISVKQQNKIRAYLLEKDDNGVFVTQPSEQVYDLKASIAEVTNRRLSPMEKILETIKNMPPEQRAALQATLEALRS